MTTEVFSAWLLQAALAICVLTGVSVVIVSVRAGWITKAITWAMVSFGVVGAVMLLSPKWTRFALEWGDLKAEVATLQKQKNELATQNAIYLTQIAAVSGLSKVEYASAKDVVSNILKTRNEVNWADFLPAKIDDYRVEVSSGDKAPLAGLASTLNVDATSLKKALNDSGYTLLKAATDADLKSSPPGSLWITTGGIEKNK